MKRASAVRAALIAAAVQGAVAIATARSPLLYGRSEYRDVVSDVRIYHDYASRVLAGELPYRDYVVEYPLLALPAFLGPRLFTADGSRYLVAFGVEMWLCALAIDLLLAFRSEKAAASLAWFTAYFAVLCPLAIARFDLMPTALAFAAAIAWGEGRAGLGGVLAGLGTFAKVFPGVVAAPAWVASWRRRERGAAVRGALALVATCGLLSAAWLALGGSSGVSRSLRFHTARGLEIGSLYSGVLMAWSKWVSGGPLKASYRFTSTEIEAEGAELLAPFAFAFQGTALLIVLYRAWQYPRSDLLRLSAAAVVGFIAFGKVLSPQYLIWPAPFFAALRGRGSAKARGVFLAACAATILIYPWGMHRVVSFDRWGIVLLNVRNLLLVGLWGWLVLGSEESTPETTRA